MVRLLLILSFFFFLLLFFFFNSFSSISPFHRMLVVMETFAIGVSQT